MVRFLPLVLFITAIPVASTHLKTALWSGIVPWRELSKWIRKSRCVRTIDSPFPKYRRIMNTRCCTIHTHTQSTVDWRGTKTALYQLSNESSPTQIGLSHAKHYWFETRLSWRTLYLDACRMLPRYYFGKQIARWRMYVMVEIVIVRCSRNVSIAQRYTDACRLSMMFVYFDISTLFLSMQLFIYSR